MRVTIESQTKMAATRGIHSVGFYSDLNNLTTAKYLERKKKNKGRLYEVERVISKRKSNKKVLSRADLAKSEN